MQLLLSRLHRPTDTTVGQGQARMPLATVRIPAEIRPREHLTEREVTALITAAKGNRWGQRDATMILTAFRVRVGGDHFRDRGEFRGARAEFRDHDRGWHRGWDRDRGERTVIIKRRHHHDWD